MGLHFPKYLLVAFVAIAGGSVLFDRLFSYDHTLISFAESKYWGKQPFEGESRLLF